MNAEVVAIHQDWNGCPRCGVLTGVRNIGRDHWGFCTRHRFCWLIGSNLYSGWRDETDADWKRNAEFLAKYRTVTP